MAINQDLPATDSAAALHKLIGEDSTATFENDPKFVDSDPTVDASNENLQTRADRKEVQAMPSLSARTEDDDVEEDDEDEDEDEDDDFDDDDDDEDDDDEEDDDDLEDDEDEDDEDDEEE